MVAITAASPASAPHGGFQPSDLVIICRWHQWHFGMNLPPPHSHAILCIILGGFKPSELFLNLATIIGGNNYEDASTGTILGGFSLPNYFVFWLPSLAATTAAVLASAIYWGDSSLPNYFLFWLPSLGGNNSCGNGIGVYTGVTLWLFLLGCQNQWRQLHYSLRYLIIYYLLASSGTNYCTGISTTQQ